MALWIQETYLNEDRGHIVGETGVYETSYDDKGSLYHAMVKEYGRCTGKMYIDTKEGAKTIGWVFTKRIGYSNSKDTYLQSTWISVHTGPPTKTIEYHYA